MLQRNNAITVESIRNSCRRTKIMIRHIDAMLGLYETYCAQSDNEALKRGLRIIKAMYIDETAKPVEQIAMQENVSARQVYRDHDADVWDRRPGNVLVRCQKDVMDVSQQKWYNNTVKF